MSSAAIHSRERTLAGGLAFAVHVLLLIMLVFGVSWQHKQVDTAVEVDLWRDLPTAAPPKVEPPPKIEPPKPAPKPEPPPPAPKVEVKPPPKPEPAPAPKPDIALKEKLEKERKLKEQQEAEAKKAAVEKARQAELEKKKRAEADALKKKQTAEAEALKKKQAAEVAAKNAAAEEQKARDALAAQQAAAAKREIDKYMDGIRTKVKRFVVVPPSVQGNPEAEVEVTLLPGGEVLNVRISKSSGNTAYDAAVESAIRKAQPLVVPTGEQFQRYFRRFTMAFRPVQ
jgi:colicin import membrane protein